MKVKAESAKFQNILALFFFIYILYIYFSNQFIILYWVQCHRKDISLGALSYFSLFLFFFFLYILPGARFRALSAGAHCTLRVHSIHRERYNESTEPIDAVNIIYFIYIIRLIIYLLQKLL